MAFQLGLNQNSAKPFRNLSSISLSCKTRMSRWNLRPCLYGRLGPQRSMQRPKWCLIAREIAPIYEHSRQSRVFGKDACECSMTLFVVEAYIRDRLSKNLGSSLRVDRTMNKVRLYINSIDLPHLVSLSLGFPSLVPNLNSLQLKKKTPAEA
jgi:hypothetical protein